MVNNSVNTTIGTISIFLHDCVFLLFSESKQDTMVKITGFREQKGSDEAEKTTTNHKRLDERNGVSNTSSSL